MAEPTPEEVREQIEAIIRTHLNDTITTVHDGPECPVAEEDLPLAIVVTRGSTRSSTNANWLLKTCIYEIVVLVTALCNDSVEEQRRVQDATEALIDILPDYFFHSAKRLELNKTPMDGIRETGPVSDDGPEFDLWGGVTYGAVRYRLPVTTIR